MKRNVMLTVIALMLVLCLGIFAACGEEKKPAASKDPTDSSTESETPSTDVTPGEDQGNTETPSEPGTSTEPDAPSTPETPADPGTSTEPSTPAEPETPAPHTHTWDEGTVSRVATCKEEGIKVQTCACGENKLTPIPMLTEHSYDNGVTANGVKTYTCTVCGSKKTEAVAGEHTHDWKNPVETKAASCKEMGEVTFSCECGEKFSFSTTTPGDHKYTNKNGKSVCSVCGEEEPTYSSPSDIQ